MLLWFAAGLFIIGSIVFTVKYVITKYNISETVKAALQNAGSEVCKRALASTFKGMIKEKKGNVLKLEVFVSNYEKVDVTIESGGISSDVCEGMRI